MDSYKTNLDTQINKYLSLYEGYFDISSAQSWYKYIYQMVDELLRHGLQETDSLFIKQKYAEFRCYFSTANKEKEPEFIKIFR